jgi:hypothetical protein
MSDFLSALGDLGYVDGNNFIYVKRRFAASSPIYTHAAKTAAEAGPSAAQLIF